MGLFGSFKPWQIVTLVVVLIAAGGGTYGVYTVVTGTDSSSLEENQQLIPVQRGDLVNQISVSGAVSFPNRETLSFGSAGVVADLLVSEGQRVFEGDVLASLDQETVANLEKSVAQANVSLRDHQDALAELLEPASQLEVALARQKTADAEVALQSTLESLDQLTNPSAVQVAQAEAKVASSELALQNAQDALDALLEPATDLEIAQAESKVASSRLAVQNAEDTLASLMDPPSDLEVAQARAKVTDAEVVLANLEQPPSLLQVAQAESKVTDAEIALQSALEALDDFRANAVADAQSAVDSAAVALANSEADLELVNREWNTKLSDAADRVQTTGDAYAVEFKEWLGIDVDYPDLDTDADQALQAMNVDLDTVFDPSNRFGDLIQGGYNSDGLPSDDPSTTWNESIVFTWLNFSPADIVATCEPGDVPATGSCVQDEFRTAAVAYESALDNLLTIETQASKALSSAESAVDQVRDSLESAQRSLANVETDNSLDLAEKEADVQVAKSQLADALEALNELVDPQDELALADKAADIKVAESNLAKAREDLAELQTPADDLTLVNQRTQITLSEQNLRDALEALGKLSEPVDQAAVANQQEQVELAGANLDQARSDLDDLMSGQDQPEYAAKLQDVEVARLNLEDRNDQLAELLSGDPDPLDLALLQSNVASAEAALQQAEQQLADSNLTAPWSGFVSRINVESGQNVGAQATILEIVDSSVVEIEGTVDEIDVLFVRVGSTAAVTMDALPGQVLSGVVSSIATEAESQQGVVSFPISVQLVVPDGIELPEGLTAVASITIREDLDVLMVPIQALYGSFQQPTLNVMSDDRVVETPVTLGNSDDFWTVITGGVAEGDMIVMESSASQGPQFGGFTSFRAIQGAVGGGNFSRPAGGPGGGGGGGRGR